MNDHLSHQQLIAYVYQALTDPYLERVEHHLSTCPECQARLVKQKALQQRIHAGVLTLQQEVTPPAQMTFAAIAPRLKRSRRWAEAMMQSRQFIYSAVTLIVLVAFGFGVYVLFGNLTTPTVKPTPGLNTPMVIATLDPTQPPELDWKVSGDPNPLSHPSGLDVDAEGNIYIVDTGNNRIQKFDSAGQFLLMWGSQGNGDGQFNFIVPKAAGAAGDVAIDSQGNIYVADSGNTRIQKFNSEGQFLTQWGSPGVGDGQFEFPFGLAIDPQDNVYVVDANSHLQKFDSQGQFLIKWGGVGFRDGEFSTIRFVTVDGQGHIYVADRGTGRIQKFDSNGQFLDKWGSAGLDDGQFAGANGIAIDEQGYIYVTDLGNPRVQKFDNQGNFLLKWGSRGQGDGQFGSPVDIVVDRQGNVYVSDAANNTIQKFRQR